MRNLKAMKFVVTLIVFCFFIFLNVLNLKAEQTRIQPAISANLVKVNPEIYEGACPKFINFEGEINVTNTQNTPLQIRYTFIRSDGKYTPVRTLTFIKDGKQKVEYLWKVDKNQDSWVLLKILEPRVIESNKLNFRAKCHIPDLYVGQIKLSTGYCYLSVDIYSFSEFRVPIPEKAYSANEGIKIKIFKNGQLWHNKNLAEFDPQKKLMQPNLRNVAVWNNNEPLEDGQYTIKVVIDNPNILELNKTNNEKTVTLTCERDAEIKAVNSLDICTKKGGKIHIIGNRFGTQEGKKVIMYWNEPKFELPIVSWSDTHIVARIPNDPRIKDNMIYDIQIIRVLDNKNISNIKSITTCIKE